MSAKYVLKLFLILTLTASFIFGQLTNPFNRIKSFNKELFKRHLNFLGSDLFEGRAPGTLGGNLAAKYLALEFDKLKLIPIANNNTYYQNIPFHSYKPLPSCELNMLLDGITTTYKINSDFLLYQSAETIFFPNYVEIVFAGYGITAPEFNYDDYKSIDVGNKIVVILEGEPVSFDPSYFDGDLPTIYSLAEAKQRIALSKGAKGTIMIPLRKNDPNKYWESQVSSFAFENLTLASSPSTSLDILLNPAKANLLFAQTGYSIEEIYELHLKHGIKSFPLKTLAKFKGEFQQRDFVSPNIVGLLEGKDPELKDEYVIVSAHYDHLGIGPAIKGDSIYNGVFDNAAGVAALLETARMFSDKTFMNKRSIIFILTTAEEKGLLGSYFYTQNPLMPLFKTIANINIDGIASYDNFKSITGIGSEYSSLLIFLDKAAHERNLDITSIPPEFSSFEAYTKSDQHSFAKAGIPSILLLEGIDYENTDRNEAIKRMVDYSTTIYHSPFDDLNQEINYDAAAQHVELICAVIEKLANDEQVPEWFDNSPYINARKFSRENKK